MTVNALKRLKDLGQSVWYDYIRRDLYLDGSLARLIREDGLAGMTSNPTIFQKAIAETELYDDEIARLGADGRGPAQIFEGLAVRDVQSAADVFRAVYDETDGNDGFVSIEVSPSLAHDAEGSMVEADRLWRACNRPNVMVKIPGTTQGLDAIRGCLARGININITLLFSVERHRQVMEAYLSAMEERTANGLSVERIRSVASFFVSRVDTNADRKIDARANGHPLRGKLGIANARVAYQAFEEVFGTERFAALHAHGASIQRPLWASTSTKDPSYPGLYYVDALVAPNSVDTMPPETLEAYRDHGEPMVRIREDVEGANAVLPGLRGLGIDTDAIFQELEDEGIRKFSESFDGLLAAIAAKRRVATKG